MIVALALAAAFAATPQRAALQSTSAMTVRRADVVGDLATVYVSDGTIEGVRVDVPILVERFSFGWQPLEVLNEPCMLERRRIAPTTIAALMRGMPSMLGACAAGGGSPVDVGARRDVEAIRYRMRGPFVPTIIVAESFARGDWYGAGGGETFFKRIGSKWTIVETGGGALGARDLRRLGLPMSAICAFHTYDAECAK